MVYWKISRRILRPRVITSYQTQGGWRGSKLAVTRAGLGGTVRTPPPTPAAHSLTIDPCRHAPIAGACHARHARVANISARQIARAPAR